MELLKEDIKNVVSYYQKLKSVVLEEIENLSTKSDAVSRGDKALLHHFLTNAEVLLLKILVTARAIENSEYLTPTILDDYSSDSDSSECDE